MNAEEIKRLFSVAATSMGDIKITKDGVSTSLVNIINEKGKESEYVAKWILLANAIGLIALDTQLLPLVLVRDCDSEIGFSVDYDDDGALLFQSTEPVIVMCYLLESGLMAFGIKSPEPGTELVLEHDFLIEPLQRYIENFDDGDVISTLPLVSQLTQELANHALAESSVNASHTPKPVL